MLPLLQAALVVVVLVAIIVIVPFLFMIVFSFAYGSPASPPHRSAVAPPSPHRELPDDDESP